MAAQTTWRQQPLPTLSPDTVPIWRCDLRTPMDLTICRGHLRAQVARLRRPSDLPDQGLDQLLLVFEELASNGVRHGRCPVSAQVAHTSHDWVVVVTDAAPDRPPTPTVDRDPARGGLGLHLIARLCAGYGWTVDEDRKHVWGRLQATE